MEISTIFFLIVIFFIYFLPTGIAFIRKRENRVSILLLNLFLGLTFVFWVIALVWATSKERRI